jgi:hypothetical protein
LEHLAQIEWEYPAYFYLEAVITKGGEAVRLKSAKLVMLAPQFPASKM